MLKITKKKSLFEKIIKIFCVNNKNMKSLCWKPYQANLLELINEIIVNIIFKLISLIFFLIILLSFYNNLLSKLIIFKFQEHYKIYLILKPF